MKNQPSQGDVVAAAAPEQQSARGKLPARVVPKDKYSQLKDAVKSPISFEYGTTWQLHQLLNQRY